MGKLVSINESPTTVKVGQKYYIISKGKTHLVEILEIVMSEDYTAFMGYRVKNLETNRTLPILRQDEEIFKLK